MMNTPFMNANRATLRNCEIQVYTVTRDNNTEAGEPRCFSPERPFLGLYSSFLLLSTVVTVVHQAPSKRRMSNRRVDAVASDRD
jgi:hypothetical protein